MLIFLYCILIIKQKEKTFLAKLVMTLLTSPHSKSGISIFLKGGHAPILCNEKNYPRI